MGPKDCEDGSGDLFRSRLETISKRFPDPLLPKLI